MKKNTPAPGAFFLRVAAILLVLVLSSTSLLSGLYARYTTTSSAGDSARVAKFEVTQAGELLQFFSLTLSPGSQESKTVTVENKSEVTIAYTVTPTSRYNNLPVTFSTQSSTGDNILLPGERADFTFTVSWPESKHSTDYCGMVDLIQLTMTATQVN